ncbi:hypothetical protein [Actinomadura flavalba]|uniref:hypothetical protein n=1 Tax=Actinomadura flavalba TaxID=1120938 RepID=UPI00035EE919|nr:hypothetical protein [Actinomadura flavalba]
MSPLVIDTESQYQSGSATPLIRLDDHRPRELLAWREARAHLLAAGLWPIVPDDVERALRRRGWWE